MSFIPAFEIGLWNAWIFMIWLLIPFFLVPLKIIPEGREEGRGGISRLSSVKHRSMHTVLST